ncbi:hypothetical protein E2320_011192 [Naja naja]|nr:hypothetical protein E2320_011192 [Naja naja]
MGKQASRLDILFTDMLFTIWPKKGTSITATLVMRFQATEE